MGGEVTPVTKTMTANAFGPGEGADVHVQCRAERDAEVEKWKDLVKTFSAGNVALEAENETLRGTCEWQLENDRKLTESIARLRAENEELRTDKQRRLEERRELRNEMAAAEAEVERLTKQVEYDHNLIGVYEAIVHHHQVSDPDCKFCAEAALDGD